MKKKEERTMVIIWAIILMVCGIPFMAAIFNAGTDIAQKAINKAMKKDEQNYKNDETDDREE